MDFGFGREARLQEETDPVNRVLSKPTEQRSWHAAGSDRRGAHEEVHGTFWTCSSASRPFHMRNALLVLFLPKQHKPEIWRCSHCLLLLDS